MNMVLKVAKRRLLKLWYSPKVEITRHSQLARLGSKYGAWTFIHHESLYQSTLISCGLGEDASFDTEFASKYSANVVFIDPTPRAINHFEQILERTGLISECGYSNTGKQEVASYDCSALRPNQLQIIKKALYDVVGPLKFFEPPNPEHVSYSIVNFQNSYSDNSPHIEVEATTYSELLKDISHERISVLKMDIEAAEIRVIPQILKSNLMPPQLLVEFDEMNLPSALSRTNFQMCDSLLRAHGYLCAHFNGASTFLYARQTLFETDY